MPAVLGQNLKKKSVYIDKYGVIHEGSYYENVEKNNRNNMGGDRPANRVAEAPEGNTEAKKE